MFIAFTITPPGGSPFAILDATYPATLIDTHCEMSDRPRTAKQTQPGQSPVYTFARNRIWHVEGDILGTGMADYDTKRLALLAAIMPAAAPLDRFTGTIQVTDANSNVYESQVSLTSHSVPVAALYPGTSTYMFEWESDDPFVYTPAIGGTPVYI